MYIKYRIMYTENTRRQKKWRKQKTARSTIPDS